MRFDASRFGIPLLAVSYQDLVDCYCSLLPGARCAEELQGTRPQHKTNWSNDTIDIVQKSVLVLQDHCSYKAPSKTPYKFNITACCIRYVNANCFQQYVYLIKRPINYNCHAIFRTPHIWFYLFIIKNKFLLVDMRHSSNFRIFGRCAGLRHDLYVKMLVLMSFKLFFSYEEISLLQQSCTQEETTKYFRSRVAFSAKCRWTTSSWFVWTFSYRFSRKPLYRPDLFSFLDSRRHLQHLFVSP